MKVAVRRLERNDDRTRFSSGQLDLDRYFRDFAGQNQFRHHIGTTYVAAEGSEIVGFVTLAMSLLSIDGLPAALRRRMPAYPLPVLRIARLAVAQSAQRKGVGTELLGHACALAVDTDDAVSCYGVVVDAKPEAISFYERHGFFVTTPLIGELPQRPAPVPMFLGIGVLRDAAR